MARLEVNKFKMKFSQNDCKRFEKQILIKKIGLTGQKKIASSKVLIVGVGGLGCPLLIYLASAGVGNIGIIDHDKVELSNLSRQILFNKKDIGKFKVTQAKKVVKKINNKIKITTYKDKLTNNNIAKVMKKFDIICDGTDNFKTRYLINDHCVAEKKILISAAISKFDGHLFFFNFKKKNPCFRCYMPEIPTQDNNCETEGILSTVAGVMGSLQSNLVLKTILNINKDLFCKMIVFNGLNNEFRKVKLKRNPICINKC